MSLSRFLLLDKLGLPPHHPMLRYYRLLSIFLISGFMHLLIDNASGIPLHASGAITFFVTQALGIVIEDLAVATYRFLFVSNLRLPSLGERIFGRVCVLAFLTWSTPMYFYPMLWRSNTGLEDSTIPFSVVKLLKQERW